MTNSAGYTLIPPTKGFDNYQVLIHPKTSSNTESAQAVSNKTSQTTLPRCISGNQALKSLSELARQPYAGQISGNLGFDIIEADRFLKENPETAKLVEQYIDNTPSCNDLNNTVETLYRDIAIARGANQLSSSANQIVGSLSSLFNRSSRLSGSGSTSEIIGSPIPPQGLLGYTGRVIKNGVEATAYVAAALIFVLAAYGGRQAYRRGNEFVRNLRSRQGPFSSQ